MVTPALHPITIAVVGLGESGQSIVNHVRERSGVRIAALCDVDGERTRRAADAIGAEAYTDHRSLFQDSRRHGIDAHFLALPVHPLVDALLTAGSNAAPVVVSPPFARSVVEARRIVDAFKNAGAACWAPRPWRDAAPLEALARAAVGPGSVFACRVDALFGADVAGWRGDRARAGGGVLLHGAYDAIDFLVAALGLPLSVHAELSFAPSQGSPRTYDTEDAAALTLRFPRDVVAGVWAARCLGAPPIWRVRMATQRGLVEAVFDPRDRRENEIVSSASVDGAPATVVDNRELDKWPADRGASTENLAADGIRPSNALAGAIQVLNMLQGEVGPLPATAEQHLATLAVIDAAYLSAKTGASESPPSMLHAVSGNVA